MPITTQTRPAPRQSLKPRKQRYQPVCEEFAELGDFTELAVRDALGAEDWALLLTLRDTLAALEHRFMCEVELEHINTGERGLDESAQLLGVCRQAIHSTETQARTAFKSRLAEMPIQADALRDALSGFPGGHEWRPAA